MLADNNGDMKLSGMKDVTETSADDNREEQKNTTDQTVENIDLNQDDEPYEIKSVNTKDSDTDTKNMETSEILDQIMSDKDKVIGVATALIFIIGSYINFWSIYTSNLGIMNQGNLFGGYQIAGILGKLCVILAVAYLVLLFINQIKLNWYVTIALAAVFIVQVLLIVIFGGNDLGTKGVVIPGIGFFICVICTGVNLIFTRKLYMKGKKSE